MSSGDEQVAWLREQIEGDRAAALAATPGPWEFEGDDPTDDEVFTVHDGEHGDQIGHTVAFTRGYDRQVPNGQHIARHDPQDVIADCESKLAMLDWAAKAFSEHGWREPDLHSWDSETAALNAARFVRRQVAEAFRHRDGYAGHWGDAASRV